MHSKEECADIYRCALHDPFSVVSNGVQGLRLSAVGIHGSAGESSYLPMRQMQGEISIHPSSESGANAFHVEVIRDLNG